VQDPDYVKLRIVPHIDELFFSFFSVVQGKFKTIASAALVQYESRREEKRLFFEAIEEVWAGPRGSFPPLSFFASHPCVGSVCLSLLAQRSYVWSSPRSGKEDQPRKCIRARRQLSVLQGQGVKIEAKAALHSHA
jgi:hypothetical protein